MGNIIKASVTINGTRPLLWHWFGPEAIPLEKRERTGVAGNDPEEWRRTVLVTKDGQLYLDPTYVFGTVRDGGKYTKRGKGSLQKAVQATVQCSDNRVLIDRWMPGFPNGQDCDLRTLTAPLIDSDLPVYLDIRGVVNPNNRAHNVRYRIAASPNWQCTFHLLWDKVVISRNEMEAILIEAGRLVGIGNGRAIGMGRFEITSFDVTE